MALDSVEHLLQQKLRHNIAPYGLEVDCPALLQWCHEWDEPPFRHQNLARELRTWSAILARKPLARIFFNEPFCLMDASSLTGWMNAIGESCRLHSGHHAELGVTLGPEDLNYQNLALLKGLDFNHVFVKVAADFDLQELQVHKQMLADLKLPYFSLELNFDSASMNFPLRLMELLSFIEPASVCFSREIASPLQHVEQEGLIPALMQFGYFIDNTQTVLKFHSPFNKRPRDTLRLGPGSRSRFVNLQTANFSAPTPYCERLDNKLLPVATCFSGR